MNREKRNTILNLIKIQVPKFYCGRRVLTEYDVRNIQLQVAKGTISVDEANNLKIRDSKGILFNFKPDGRLTNNPTGYNICSSLTIELIRIDRENKNI